MPDNNPFDDIIEDVNPFDDIGDAPDYSTAAGRQVANMNELAAYVAQLRAIKPANDLQKKRLQQMIKGAEAELGGQAPDRSLLENITRGGAAGAIRGTMAGAKVASGLLPDFVPGVEPLRKRVAEAEAGVEEEFDPRGRTAQIAQFGGELATSMPAYGGFASGTARAIVNLAPKSIAARLVGAAATGGTAETILGRALQRSGANVLAGVPINAGLAIADENATPEEKARSFALGAAADALFGVLPHLKSKHEKAAATPAEPPKPSERRAADADRLSEEAKARAAVKEVETKLNRRAQVEWEYRNPDAVWKDLPAKEKKRVREEFKARVAAEAEQAAQSPVTPTEPPAAPTPADSKLNTLAASAGEVERRAKPRPNIDNLSPAVKEIRAKQLEGQIETVDHVLRFGGNTPDDIAKFTAMKERLRSEVDQLREATPKAPEKNPYDLEAGEVHWHDPEDATNLQTLKVGNPGIEFQETEGGMFIVARDKQGVPQAYLGMMELEPGKYGAMDVYVRSDSRRKGLATNLYKIANNAGAKQIITGYGGYTTDAGEALGKALKAKGIVSDMIPRGEAPRTAEGERTPEGKPIPKGLDETTPSVVLLGKRGAVLGTPQTAAGMAEVDNHHSMAFPGEHVAEADRYGAKAYTQEGHITVMVGPESDLELGEILKGLNEAKMPGDEVTVIFTTHDMKADDEILTVDRKGREVEPVEIIGLEKPKAPTPPVTRAPRAEVTQEALPDEKFDAFAAEVATSPYGSDPTAAGLWFNKLTSEQRKAAIARHPEIGGRPEDLAGEESTRWSIALWKAEGSPDPTTPPRSPEPSPTPLAPPAVPTPSPTTISDEALRDLHTLRSVTSKKPVYEMTDAEFDKAENKVLEVLEASEKKDPDKYALAQEDLQRLMDEQKRRNQGGKVGELPLPEGVVRRPEMATGVTGAAFKSGGPARVDKLADQPARVLSPDQSRKLFKTPIAKISDADLMSHIQDLDDRVSGMTLAEAKEAGYTKRLSDAMEERAKRKLLGPGPATAQMPPGVGGAALGFTLGLTAPAKDEEDRWGNAWMGLAIGAGVGVIGPRAISKFRESKAKYDFLPGEANVAKVVASVADVPKESTSFIERMRNLYWGVARRSYGLDRAAAHLGVERAPTSKNFAKLGAIFGRWVSMSESALQDGPRLIDGETKLDSPSVADIFQVAGGTDEAIDRLGHLMTARTSLELAGSQTVPVDPVSADLLYRNAPENLHQAADMARKFSLAMAQVLVDAQVLAQNTIAKFQQEEFYAPLHRLFAVERPPKLLVEQSGKVVVVSPNPVKGRKGGSQLVVQNPVEAMVGMVPRIYRAAELNRIKIRALEAWEAAGKPSEIFKRIRKAEVQNTQEFDMMIKYLKQEVKRLSQGEAESLVAALHEKSLDPSSATMTVYRNGALESYRVNKEVAESLNAMNPADMHGLFKLLGAPTQVARLGIVNNPYFVAKMAFIDNWQAFMNSQYGFRFGVDQLAGWWNIVRRSPEYKNYVAGGGGHSSLSSYQYTNVRTAIPAIRSGSEGALSAAWKDMKEFRPLDAWRQLIIPVAEAARVGEYLAARRHGADVLEAVYAAKHVTGNFGQRGGYTEMQALNHMALFTNPAIQALDQALYRAGAHPFRTPEEGRLAAAATYLTKGFVSISLPSYLLWHAYKDDQEINDLRMTETGRKFWFIRSKVDVKALGIKQNDIIRIPKPIFEGQLFGTSTEAVLDQRSQQDPEAMRSAVNAVMQDASFNLAPTVGVTLYSLAAGKGPFGNDLVPGWEQGLSLEHQGEEKASWMARAISKKIAPNMENVRNRLIRNSVTPAGIDYLFQSVTGMLGADAMKAVTIAMDREEKGYTPAKAELPVIGRLFADYPSLNVQPIREFYNRSSRIDEVNKTIDHWAIEDPNKLAKYMMEHQEELQLIGLNSSVRQKMANFSRAIHDTRAMPKDYVSYEDRKSIIKQYMTVMIEQARVANSVARSVDVQK